jgi:hypothetical protein
MEDISASSPVKRWVLAILPMLALKKGCAWVRVAPVPASPLLTGCGRYDLPAVQGRDEERAFRSEQGTAPRGGSGEGKNRGLARSAKGDAGE